MHKLGVVIAVVLASSSTAWAQADKKAPAATAQPTQLPGEEKLSAQERAERDFLMPVRRKQAATLRAAAQEVPAPAVEVTARNLEAGEDDKPTPAPEVLEAKAAPATVHRRPSSSHRRSSASRHGSTARKKKVVHKSSSARKKTTATRRSSRRR